MFGDILKCYNWRSLWESRKDTWLVMMYKIASENVAITEETIMEQIFLVIHYPSLKDSTKTRIVFHSYDIWLELVATTNNFELCGWNIQGCGLLYQALIYETSKQF